MKLTVFCCCLLFQSTFVEIVATQNGNILQDIQLESEAFPVAYFDPKPIDLILSSLDASRRLRAAKASFQTPPPSSLGLGLTQAPTSQPTPMDVINHGGSLMTGKVRMYNIWYGPTFNTTAKQSVTLLNGFVSSLGSSPWFSVQKTYLNAVGISASTELTLNASIVVMPSTQTASITTSFVTQTITKLLQSGRLPVDANGIYNFYFGGVKFSGFCSVWCGFHSLFSVSTGGTVTKLKYTVVGDSSQDSSGNRCQALTSATSNGNVGADSMANVIAHELAEVVTDPDFAGYYDAAGWENADKCAWTFGTMRTANSNTVVGSKAFLLQQNWAHRPPNSGCVNPQ